MDTERDTAGPRIVVGVDGSPAADQALRWAAEEARIRGARLEVIHGWDIPWVGLPGLSPSYAEQDFEHHAEAVIDTALAGLPPGGAPLDVTRRPVRGHAAAALIEASAGAALVVVGSHGHGGVTGTLLGSVSQRVAHHARCPVVIVRTHP